MDKLLDGIADASLRQAIVSKGIQSEGRLVTLTARNAGIKTLEGLQAFTQLRRLDLSGNDIDDLSPLSGLLFLTGLFLADNAITSIESLGKLRTLPALDLGGNAIRDLSPLAEVRALTWLNVSRNHIASLAPLGACSCLTNIVARGNVIVDLKGIDRLELLRLVDVSSNCLTGTIEVPGTWRLLRRLTFARNSISAVSIEGGTSPLVELDLSGNDVQDISFLSDLTCLEVANLSENPLQSTAAFASCPHLRVLYLWMTGIDEIAGLKTLHKLEELGIADNAVTDVTPLLAMKHLKLLYLGANAAISEMDVKSLAHAVKEDFRGPDWKERLQQDQP